MEQKEKIEKPAWVLEVDKYPDIVRNQIGSTAAGIITSLFQLWLLDRALMDAVISEVKSQIEKFAE